MPNNFSAVALQLSFQCPQNIRWAEPRPRPENGRTGDKPTRGFVPPCYAIVMNIFTFK